MKYCYYILLIICFCSCNEATDHIQPNSETDIEGNFDFYPPKIKAGESISVRGNIVSKSPMVGEVKLDVEHAMFSKSYPVKINKGEFELEIPSIDNQIAGEVNSFLVCQGIIVAKGTYFIHPLEAIDKMQNFNGPKDLFAGDEDASMNVSIPHDKFDNPLLPPAEVNYNKSFEGEIQSSESKAIEHLLTYQITSSKQTKGKYLIGSNSSEGFSKEQELIIGAGMPQTFNIELLSFHPFADARQFIQFKTTVLKDQYDNVIADGTLINFTVEEAGAIVGVYQSITIGGVANVFIENPSYEVSWIIQANLHDQIVSNKVLLSFSKNVTDFDLSWDSENKIISIGPVIGILGQSVPDGTEVKVSNTDKDLEDYIFLEEGKYKYKLPFDWLKHKPDQLKILIGGHEKTIKLE